MASVRTNLTDSFLSLISTIQIENGYQSNMGDILTETHAITQFKNFPACNVEFGQEAYENASNPTLDQSRKLYKKLPIFLDVYFQAYESPEIVRERIIWDIRRLLMNNYSLNGYCHEVMFSDTLPFGVTSNEPLFGFSIQITVFYQTDLLNPSILV